MKKASPKWTMTSRQFYTHQEFTPGPGAYSLKSTLTGPNVSLDRSPRSSLVPATAILIPGPGAYTPSKPLPSLGNTLFPRAARKSFETSQSIPGPGQYFSESKPEGPQFSLRGRSQDISQEIKPGPGNYNPSYDYTLEKRPCFKLGTSKRTTSLVTSTVPGPGNYSLRNTLSGPNWGFGSSPRSTSYETQAPGPGAYSIKSHSNQISFSMTPRRPLIENIEKTPGPGTYSYMPQKDLPIFSISKSTRKGIALETLSPGPGAYSPEFPKSQQRNIFGTAPRVSMPINKNTPGPGNYNPASLKESPSFSLRSRPIEKVVERAPGPGKYDPNSDFILESPVRVALPRSQKNSETDTEKNNKLVPGPGSYSKPSTLTGPKWGFGSSIRGQEKEVKAPGPGAYNV